MRPTPRQTRFPYTTLFRSGVGGRADAVDRVALGVVRAAAEADRLALVELGHDARHDAQQLQRTAADDRQVVDLLRAQHAFRSEEHTSELQSLRHLVCRLLL